MPLYELLHTRHNLCDDNAVAVLVLENDRLLDRVVLRVHRDRARADDEILRLLDRLAQRLGIIRARALQRVDEELAYSFWNASMKGRTDSSLSE